MKFFAFIFFTYGIFCIILALLQIRYFYKNKSDKKFIDFKQYTKSRVSLLLTVSILSILLSLIMLFKSLPITIVNPCFSLILAFYIFTLNRLNKKYGIPKQKLKK
ncbi:Uncharacterised protein [[Clostridium] sordellii]|uniref:DUF3784 domain-containing protein n=1 Tax=Paraclostridium sordellii TaxID=1505 RepID=A0ABP1XQE0_PARSO|nr:hypothetical protein [Paeniclostridium sordellii]CEJ73561.1 hypothetical protein ATCC9714_14491 [[Clostridium] sordellii] [Paeniclostridium sordellii]CEN69111.1 Uncharacterised protein [[Clostridium] sordellii] [Paeniclostridium sordellii]CEN72379.1 Uncharacterised protein [[Clostridium] sordellii] [Paeniclostridium sordellii]CEO23760.1 Uncharacterised protein [[Clostridium] sordellii] [Paeniclostridium sordellii]CEP76028.1 Uncharacterised protein [[Clostridium] sordellii] [Paeniclostridium